MKGCVSIDTITDGATTDKIKVTFFVLGIDAPTDNHRCKYKDVILLTEEKQEKEMYYE